MPLYAAEWLADQRVIELSPEAKGCLIDLWCVCWRDGFAFVSVEKLARLWRVRTTKAARVWSEIAQFFAVDAEGRATSRRLEKERAERQALAQARQDKARTAAEERWNKERARAPSNAQASAQAMPAQCSSSASAMPRARAASASASASGTASAAAASPYSGLRRPETHAPARAGTGGPPVPEPGRRRNDAAPSQPLAGAAAPLSAAARASEGASRSAPVRVPVEPFRARKAPADAQAAAADAAQRDLRRST